MSNRLAILSSVLGILGSAIAFFTLADLAAFAGSESYVMLNRSMALSFILEGFALVAFWLHFKLKLLGQIVIALLLVT